MSGLERDARRDPLTGLANRRALDESLDREVALHARRGLPLSAVMIDIDRFKDYNDTFGHPAGDLLLCRFAARLTSRMRQSDLVVRYGGEEFCIVLPATAAPDAEVAVEDIRRGGPVATTPGTA